MCLIHEGLDSLVELHETYKMMLSPYLIPEMRIDNKL